MKKKLASRDSICIYVCTFCTCLPIFQPKKVGCHEITNDETSEKFAVDPLQMEESITLQR